MVRGQFGADNSALGGWKTDAWTLGKHSWFNYCMALSVTRLADFSTLGNNSKPVATIV